MDDSLKTPETLVKGCTSRVWLIAEIKDGRFHFTADSDAHIVRGLVYLLLTAYQDRTAAEIRAVDIKTSFDRMGLHQHLSPSRRNASLPWLGKESNTLAGRLIKAYIDHRAAVKPCCSVKYSLRCSKLDGRLLFCFIARSKKQGCYQAAGGCLDKVIANQRDRERKQNSRIQPPNKNMMKLLQDGHKIEKGKKISTPLADSESCTRNKKYCPSIRLREASEIR